MSLRESAERTPALLAALRRNGQKCAGPKTPKGKARSSRNASKHGRFAHRLAQKLGAAGVAGLFERFHHQIPPTYRPESAVGAIRHNWMRKETGMSFGMSAVKLTIQLLFQFWAGRRESR